MDGMTYFVGISVVLVLYIFRRFIFRKNPEISISRIETLVVYFFTAVLVFLALIFLVMELL